MTIWQGILMVLPLRKGNLLIVSTIRIRQEPYYLPNGLREALLGQGYGKSLLVIEGMYTLKYDGETWLTFDQFYRLLSDNFGMSYQLVYHGLNSGIIFQRRKALGKAHQRGARPYLYRLPFPAELEAEFAPELPATPHDELERKDLKTLKAYRLGLHREKGIRLFVDNGGKGYEMFRDLQADSLGVSKRTIRGYDKILGFSYEANFVKKSITNDNWNDLPRYKDKFDINGKRLPSRKWLETYDWKTATRTALPLVRYLAYMALKDGLEVWEVQRTANTYYPYQKPDLSQFDRLSDTWVVDCYYADQAARNAAGFYQKSDGTWFYQRE